MSKHSKHPSSKAKEPEHVLVYSTDPIPAKKAPEVSTDKPLNPVISFEKKGRGGKSVTLLKRLPAHETFLKDLCAFLKRSAGTGGTFYIEAGEGIIEIQGERREQIAELVKRYKTK